MRLFAFWSIFQPFFNAWVLSLNPVYVLATMFHYTEFICGFKIVIPSWFNMIFVLRFKKSHGMRYQLVYSQQELSSYAAVSLSLRNVFPNKQLKRTKPNSRPSFPMCFWSNEQTNYVSETAKGVSRVLWTCLSKIINHRLGLDFSKWLGPFV